LTEADTLISADVFEQNFSRACGDWAEICREHPRQWLDRTLAPQKNGQATAFTAAVAGFARSTAGYDFVSPGFNGFHLLPLLAILRGDQGPRLLFIAHAPVQHAVELSLVADLLRPGDVIICPSRNAREILCAFSARLAPYAVGIPHCIPPLPRPPVLAAASPRRIVSLGRITEDKLIHRQIDALALCVQQGGSDVVMEIAGPCVDERGRVLGYVHELQARVRRLGLERQVRFVGPLHGPEEQGAFLAGAAVCVNLSRAAEESFGKTCAEAVTMGVPVVATRWNGLPETVGPCGDLLPVQRVKGRWIVDVDPADCARAIRRLLHDPPSPADFSRQQRVFSSDCIGGAYKKALLQPPADAGTAPETTAAPDVFALIPAIRAFSGPERRRMYLAGLGVQAEDAAVLSLDRDAAQWRILADLIFQSVRARGQQLLSHCPECAPAAAVDEPFLAASPWPEQLEQEWEQRLFADCLRECDGWARELTLIRLAADSPGLSAWVRRLLETHQGSAGMVVQARVHSLLAAGAAEDAARFLKNHLSARPLAEHDVPLLLLLVEICRQADCGRILTDVLGQWLAIFPDGPQCAALWPVLAFNLIVREESYALGKQALEHAAQLLPDFDASHLRGALTALQCV
jgi:glycosyltransferase involved in cell wall biosynthesis